MRSMGFRGLSVAIIAFVSSSAFAIPIYVVDDHNGTSGIYRTYTPGGTPEEVGREVHRMVRVLGRDGGYVLGAVHNIQADVPPENVVAMYDGAM